MWAAHNLEGTSQNLGCSEGTSSRPLKEEAEPTRQTEEREEVEYSGMSRKKK